MYFNDLGMELKIRIFFQVTIDFHFIKISFN